jgi:hypothetical protein
MWGFRPTGKCGGSGTNGAIITAGNLVRNVLFLGNVLFDGGRGIHSGVGARYISIIGNTIVNIHGGRYGTLGIWLGELSEAYGNTLSRVDGHWAVVSGRAILQCNVVLESGRANTHKTGMPTADYNTYYDTPRYSHPGKHDIARSREPMSRSVSGHDAGPARPGCASTT